MITGGAGFIGKALVRELLEHDHGVDVFDHSIVPQDDVRNPVAVMEAVSSRNLVIHLAAEVGKLNCEQNPHLATQTNIVGTLNVARACAEYRVPLVYCSTSEIYGDWGRVEVDEETRPDGHLSGVYAITKAVGETISETYAPDELKIIRPTMPYGPGVPPGPGRRAIDNLVWQALTGQTMVVHRGAARSWCWIDDLASGIRTVIEKGEPGIYNVGRDDDEVSMLTLAEKICATVNLQPGFDRSYGSLFGLIEIVDPPARQTAVKRISCAKLRALGWEPKTSLEKGLPQMVEWIRQWLEMERAA